MLKKYLNYFLFSVVTLAFYWFFVYKVYYPIQINPYLIEIVLFLLTIMIAFFLRKDKNYLIISTVFFLIVLLGTKSFSHQITKGKLIDTGDKKFIISFLVNGVDHPYNIPLFSPNRMETCMNKIAKMDKAYITGYSIYGHEILSTMNAEFFDKNGTKIIEKK